LFKGKILCKSDSTPVQFVNIGIIDRGIGTVSDIDGRFSLKIPDNLLNDSIRISSIGYKSIVFKVGNILKNRVDSIFMEKEHYELSEVIIKPEKYKEKQIGNIFQYGIAGSYDNDQLGHELGIKIELKGKPSLIEGLGFYLSENSCGPLLFRVNIYTIKDSFELENILKQKIFIKTEKKTGDVYFDLEKYNIIMEEDFVITIEWIKNYEKACIYFRMMPGISKCSVYSRQTSQAKWKIIDNYKYHFYVSVKQWEK
jgi:hypothetical protein